MQQLLNNHALPELGRLRQHLAVKTQSPIRRAAPPFAGHRADVDFLWMDIYSLSPCFYFSAEDIFRDCVFETLPIGCVRSHRDALRNSLSMLLPSSTTPSDMPESINDLYRFFRTSCSW